MSSASVPNKVLADLAEEMRALWRTLSRGTQLSGCSSDQPQRQQYWTLGVLKPGPLRMSELAERACTSQASITGVVDRLEALGFVERSRPAQDRRVVEVALTLAGLAELDRVRSENAERMRALTEALTAEETQDLLRLLRKITRTHPTQAC